MQVDSSPSVDVFVTAYNEEFTLIERCLQAACQMRGAHCTWLLDDGHDPKLEQLAERLGAGYLTRPHRRDAKAGNINTALPRTTGDIIAIFDIDHIPQADFLEQTLPFFANPRIGFVQVMLTFANSEESWVARAAIETSSDFYNATSIGADSIRGATLVGSNALIRRQALESIGGYQPGLAEDLATSIALHAAGWGSVYVRKPLAPGLAPPDLAAWFTQQLKWSRGVFDLLLTAYPHHFAALALGQKISYAVRMTYYWIGPAIFLHLLATWFVLYMGEGRFLAVFHEYLMHIVPLAFMTWLIRARSFRIWRHPTEQAAGQWSAVLLVYTTWPIYTLAWLMAICRLPLAFRPTPKKADGLLRPLWLAPQAISVLLLTIGTVLSWSTIQAHPLVFLFVIAQVVPQVWVIIYQLMIQFIRAPERELKGTHVQTN
ncbi:MAG: glycosyltransferase [Caldilineaceae bacterium]|nr:glycosyltransferase [Caldilineaceae bacterium]